MSCYVAIWVSFGRYRGLPECRAGPLRPAHLRAVVPPL